MEFQPNLLKRAAWRTALVLSCAALAAGCSSSPATPAPTPEIKPPSHNGGMFRERNEGYSLLYKLMSDEKDVGKIFILKSASDPVKGLVKEIGGACDAAKKQMDGFPAANNRIEFDVLDLPKLEQKARDFEAKEDEHGLLFNSGETFEVRLVFSQLQAMGYGMNLCKALIEAEDDEGHKQFLTNLSNQCSEFHDRLLALLAVKS
jgi:hypothetical protein